MFCNKINGRMFLLWHWCQRGRKESSSKCFGNRVDPEWPNAEESWVWSWVWMQVLPSMPKGEIVGKFSEQTVNVCHWWQQWRWKNKIFKHKSSGGTAWKKTRAEKLKIQEFAEDKEDGECWIPSKFPERPIIVRSSAAVQRLSTGVKSYCAEEKYRRNRDHPFARTGGKESGIGVSRVPCSITTKTPKSRYAISRFDRSRRARSDLDRWISAWSASTFVVLEMTQ